MCAVGPQDAVAQVPAWLAGMLPVMLYVFTSAVPIEAVVAARPAADVGKPAANVYCKPCNTPSPVAKPFTVSNATEVGEKVRVQLNVKLTGVPVCALA